MTNIPVMGTLMSVTYAKPSAKYPGQPQVCVEGTWEGAVGHGRFWLPYFVAKHFTAAGLIRYTAMANGQPQFAVVSAQQRVYVRRREEGTKKITEVFPLDFQGNVVQLSAQPDPPEESTFLAAAGAPAGQPTTAAQPGAPGAPAVGTPIGGPAPGATPAAAPAQTNEERKEVVRKQWLRIREAVMGASRIAAESLAAATGCELKDLDQRAVAQHANEVLIIAERSAPGLIGQTFTGLLTRKKEPAHSPPPARAAGAGEKAPTPAAAPGAFDDFPEALGEEDDDLPF